MLTSKEGTFSIAQYLTFIHVQYVHVHVFKKTLYMYIYILFMYCTEIWAKCISKFIVNVNAGSTKHSGVEGYNIIMCRVELLELLYG